MKYSCSHCTTHFPTKQTYELHQFICNIIKQNDDNELANNIKVRLPSKEVMFQYLIHLTNKYQRLEEKVDRLQKTTTNLRKKHIHEYIETLQPPSQSYSIWLENVQITDENLNILFDEDLTACIKDVLDHFIQTMNYPFYAFQQKVNILYLYDDGQWRIMTQKEIEKLVNVLSIRVLKKYMVWAENNKTNANIEDDKTQETSMIYLSKANGLNCPFDTRVLNIKKWLFQKINVSLNHLEA